MELDMTNTIGAIAITMKQLGFDGKDIDIYIPFSNCARQFFQLG